MSKRHFEINVLVREFGFDPDTLIRTRFVHYSTNLHERKAARYHLVIAYAGGWRAHVCFEVKMLEYL